MGPWSTLSRKTSLSFRGIFKTVRDRVASWRLNLCRGATMEKQVSRQVICPKCKRLVKVRDIAHFKQHGIKITRWRCPDCDREVASDRATDLRDHLRRRHPERPLDSIIPIWGNVDVDGQGLSSADQDHPGRTQGRSRQPARPAQPLQLPSPQLQKQKPPRLQQSRQTTVPELVIGNPEEEASFLTVSSGPPATPTRSVVRRIVQVPVSEPAPGERESGRQGEKPA